MYDLGTAAKNQAYTEAIHSSVRAMKCRVNTFNSSGVGIKQFDESDYVKSVDIEQIGNNNFFGSVVSQKANIHILNQTTSISSGQLIRARIGLNSYLVPSTYFKITEVHRDQETKEFSITAYDFIYGTDKMNISPILDEINTELEDETISSYSLGYLLEKIAEYIGCFEVDGTRIVAYNGADDLLYDEDIFSNYDLDNPINLNGEETIRQVLEYIAQVGLCVIYMQHDGRLAYKRLQTADTAQETAYQSDYITFSTNENRRLVGLCKTNDLGNNIEAKLDLTGTIYYIRNNPFLEMVEDTDVADYLNARLEEVKRLTINQIDCEWFGNNRLEFGDKIEFEDKDGSMVSCYILNNSFSYDGSFRQQTEWEYNEEESTDSNPSTLGAVLNDTYARVDKANKEITLLVSDVNQVTKNISEVEQAASDAQSAADNAQNNITVLQQNITEIKQDSDSIKLSVKNIEDNGVSKIETEIGYTFDDSGLNIARTDSNISTRINEDGMVVKKNNEDMLVANNQGVDAVNLHAKTYLIIGSGARFEDYYKDSKHYTACFWVGE